MMQTLDQVLDDASRAIEIATWEKFDEFPTDHDAVAYRGRGDGWEFLVVSFSIEDQGFPKGSRGWDGTGRKKSTVLHLTRELAERGFRLATLS